MEGCVRGSGGGFGTETGEVIEPGIICRDLLIDDARVDGWRGHWFRMRKRHSGCRLILLGSKGLHQTLHLRWGI